MTDIAHPQNIIFTGVAGTGKTYQLQKIAEQYTEFLPIANSDELLKHLVEPLSWREVICLVFLEERQKGKTLLKVPEILNHPFFILKANLNHREENLSQTVWSTLMTYSDKDSENVKYYKRASQAFFDKDESSNWFLIEESLPLLSVLQNKLIDYHSAIDTQFQPKIERFSLVSFHQAYGYEEFVEGIRPKINDKGQMTYCVEQGAFLRLCEKAKADPTHRYAMLIDEINRANVSRVFGELMSLIEPSKRVGQSAALSVNLAYSHRPFSVPSNIDIYATMNTQDHSLAPLDMAFRRRFHFIDCPPQADLLEQIVVGDTFIDLAKLITALNAKITQNLGRDNQIGHSYFMEVHDLQDLADVFAQMIIPQLIQASHGNANNLQAILGEDIIHQLPQSSSSVYPNSLKSNFNINQQALSQVSTYQAFY